MVNNPNINAREIMKLQVVKQLGLNDYKYLISKLKLVNTESNVKYQKKFNSLYKVRRNSDWRKEYYKYLEKNKANKGIKFESIIEYLYENTQKIEPSFSSKMLATIDVDKPIWDGRILERLDLKRKWDKRHDINNAVDVYDDICKWYKEYEKTEEYLSNIKVFDEFLPEYEDISDTKKIDCLLWGWDKGD